MPKSFTGYTSVDQALAGFGAGMVSTIILHPLDLIKTRFQVDESLRSVRRPLIGGTIKAWKTIARNETVWGLYRGLSANVAGATASWGFYFWWCVSCSTRILLKGWMPKDENGRISAIQYLTASAEAGMSVSSTCTSFSYLYNHTSLSFVFFLFPAGAITAVMTNPFWVVKTRMCAAPRTAPGAYRGLWDGLRQIAAQEGVRGLYKGMVPALFGVSHGALQFMAYEELKHWRIHVRPRDEKDKLVSLTDRMEGGTGGRWRRFAGMYLMRERIW
ncbi:mitochondrial carrier domain-containing protein [Jimgerdemannia flammicorona]|uniref:Mitochondrial carrier domain-containing protein n=1 Tax=Jimgerdemannia flammicorona TaxID=994334 RepID=A0A433PEH7_9FUNG|nr:mitochondrial carrier domain-containing protein [Jimgerdemannia flammicorona]